MLHLSLLLVVALSNAGTSAADVTWEEDNKKIAACFGEMDHDPALAVVNAKFARGEPTTAQLADMTYASEVEADALRLRMRTTRPCRDLRLAAVKAHHALLEPAYTTLYYRADQVFDYLTQGFISHGLANRLAWQSLGEFRKREKAFAAAASDERRTLSQAWSETLQRAHSNPPPDGRRSRCVWREINIECE